MLKSVKDYENYILCLLDIILYICIMFCTVGSQLLSNILNLNVYPQDESMLDTPPWY